MRRGSAATLHPWARRSRSGPAGGSASDDELVTPGVLVGIVNARGAIDARTIDPFARELGRSIAAGATRLLVDLSQADEVAATCMNFLLAARQELSGRRGRIALVLAPAMRRRFETLGLDRRFTIADNRMQAARLLGLTDGSSPDAGEPRPHAHAA